MYRDLSKRMNASTVDCEDVSVYSRYRHARTISCQRGTLVVSPTHQLQVDSALIARVIRNSSTASNGNEFESAVISVTDAVSMNNTISQRCTVTFVCDHSEDSKS
jgi:hypothetical protein